MAASTATVSPRRAAQMTSNVISAVLLAFLAVAVTALVLVPKLSGGHALTVLSASMTPAYAPGDVVVVVPRPAADLQVGDVVTFMPKPGDPTLVTHRVIHKLLTPTGTQFITRGDANGSDDVPITEKQLLGAVLYKVPKVGWALNALDATSGRGLVVGGIAVVLIAWGVAQLVARPSSKEDS